MKSNNLPASSANLVLVILIFVVLACSCPHSQEQKKQVTNTPSPILNSNSLAAISPTPLPAASSSPIIVDLNTPEESQARITKGEQIYKRIESRTGLPVMFGWRAQKMSLLIPTSNWNKMSKEDQINLTYYAENLLQEIRKNPEPYVKKWVSYYKRTEQLEDGGEYDGLYESSYISQVKNLCASCWDISLGQAKRDGFYDEETPVKGTTVQNFRATETTSGK